MNLRITYAKYSEKDFGALIRTIDEVGNLYELNNVSFDFDIFHSGDRYTVKFRLYG